VNPFAALGLSPAAGIADAEVRAAWRDTAAATHPDRGDGGDPAAYAAAANAYAQLRTAWGRTEALADLADRAPTGIPPPEPAARLGSVRSAWHAVALLPARARRGRPARLAIRTAIAIAVAVLAALVIPGTPSAPAVVAGCALWWALTARGDLAPPPGR
jgi:curved DNA-binding protein CbpA